MDAEHTDAYWVGALTAALMAIAELTTDDVARQTARRTLRRLGESGAATESLLGDIARVTGELHSVKVQP